MPQEIVYDVMRFDAGIDFMKIQATLYPKTMFVRVGKEFIDIPVKSAYCFAAIRKKLVKTWEVGIRGPKIEPESSEGMYNNPLDITDLVDNLSDFKILCMLLSDDEHEKVKNLPEDVVQRIDEMTYHLKMDTYRWIYIGRSRLNDETGNQIQCTFYGKNVTTQGAAPYDIDGRFSNTINRTSSKSIERMSTALEI